MTAHDTPMPGADYVHTPLRIGTEKRVRLPGQHIVLTMLSLSLEDTFKEPDTGWSDKQWLPDATIVAGIIYAWQYRRTDDDLSVSRLIEVPTNIRSEVKERVRAALARDELFAWYVAKPIIFYGAQELRGLGLS